MLPWTFDRLRSRPKPSSIVIAVSPLFALMKDQVSSILKEGLSVVYAGEQSNDDDKIVQIHHGGQ